MMMPTGPLIPDREGGGGKGDLVNVLSLVRVTVRSRKADSSCLKIADGSGKSLLLGPVCLPGSPLLPADNAGLQLEGVVSLESKQAPRPRPERLTLERHLLHLPSFPWLLPGEWVCVWGGGVGGAAFTSDPPTSPIPIAIPYAQALESPACYITSSPGFLPPLSAPFQSTLHAAPRRIFLKEMCAGYFPS